MYFIEFPLKISICFLRYRSDERPTTSRHAKRPMTPKKKLKHSPWKNGGGKVNRFKKLKDDQARKLVRRSFSIINDNQLTKKFNKKAKRFVNNNHMKLSPKPIKYHRKIYHKGKDISSVSTLEDGEIRSEDERSRKRIVTVDSDDDDEFNDDCIIIAAPTVEPIVIDDDDDDEDDDDKESSTSNLSTNYQSLMKTLNQNSTSTPCNKKLKTHTAPTTYADVAAAKDNSLFFIDVNGARSGCESINSTDTFCNYTKLNSILGASPKRKKKDTPSDNKKDADDSSNLSNNSTLKPNQNRKRKSCEMDNDDSVIFIKETNPSDFIPLPEDKKAPLLSPPPQSRAASNLLHNKKETKQLTAYNENAYNPSAGEELTTGKRMVFIDGSNVAYKHSCDKEFSVKGIKIALEYFEKMGHEVKAVIPQFRMNKNRSSDPEELERLHKSGKIVQTPSKNLPGLTCSSYDDRFILQLAFELDAAIVSNDNYRDLLHENPSFKKIIENRVIGYTWCNDIFILPKDPYGKWGPTLHTILNRC